MPAPGSFIGPLAMHRLPIWCFHVTGGAFVAAFQTASFLSEGWSHSSVVATSNFRYLSPALRVWSMCIAFGMGAAGGAVMTEVMRARSRAVPVALLVLVLLLCAKLNARRAVAVVVHVGDLI